MNVRRPISLIARRAIAFAFDLAFLLFLLGLGCIVASIVVDDEFLNPAWSPILIGAVLSYFGVFESLRSGQTPGKRMTGIHLEMSSGQRVTPFSAFARISLILLFPLATVLFYQLLGAFPLTTIWGMRLAYPFLLVVSCAIWPVSAIIGGGRIGMQDFLLGTVVKRAGVTDDPIPPLVTWLYPCTVVFVSSVVALVVVNMILSCPMATIENFFDGLTGPERLVCVHMGQAVEDLSLRIENGPEFIGDRPTVFFNRWTSATWKEWSVSRSCAALPDDIRNGTLGFRIHVRYKIPVTARGLTSATFQQAAARDICRRAMGPGVFMTFEFVHTRRAWMFEVVTRKKCLAFLYDNSDKEAPNSTLMALLEPNLTMVVCLRVAIGGASGLIPF